MYDDWNPQEQQQETDRPNHTRVFPANLEGQLLLLWSIEHIENAPGGIERTDGRDPDAIAVDVVCLTQANDEGNDYLMGRNVWWRAGSLIALLRPRVGNPNAILVMLTKVRVPKGMKFELVNMAQNPEARARADRFVSIHPDWKPSQPRGVQQSQAPATVKDDPWRQPVAAPFEAPQPQAPPAVAPFVHSSFPVGATAQLPPPPPDQTVLERLSQQHENNATLASLSRPSPNTPPDQLPNPPF